MMHGMETSSTQWMPNDSSAIARNIINNRIISAGTPWAVFNPADWSEVVGYVYLANLDLVDQAVAAAAFALPAWARTTVQKRIDLIGNAITAIGQVAPPEAFARLITREQGKPLLESTYEATHHLGLFETFRELAEHTLKLQENVDRKGRHRQSHIPVGPVAIVTPRNWSVALSLAKVLPALLSGNTVVLKPAPNTPLAISIMIEAIATLLPPGVLNIIQGESDIGAALVSHPQIRKVVFVGSTANGRRVYAACADNIKRVTLELGGNDPAVLLDDFELNESNLSQLVHAAFVTAGQTCWAIKRLYVPANRHDEVVTALSLAIDDLIVIGNGLDPSVTMGPLNNRVQYKRVGSLIDEARALGGHLIECGKAAPSACWNEGFFRHPMIITGLSDSAGLVTGEQFGPVLPVLAYESLDQAVNRANASDYGLCASVWGTDEDRAYEIATRMEAGRIFINCHAGAAINYDCLFGGVKQSGLGHEHGPGALLDYMDTRLYSNRLPLEL